jgi:glyoxylase-like metal-dependent hydrolase (beta-lactamase superfamily II)
MTLEDGTTLSFAGVDLDVLHTPGHTPGHCCFHLATDGILFSGDQLFAGSIGRTDLPGGNYEQLMTSMATRVLTLGDDTRVLPGHGPATTIARERLTNPFLVGLGTR